MTDETKQHVADWLNRFPEVRWDRLTEDAEEIKVYGWIARGDSRADFVLLDFWNGPDGRPGLATSSATLSVSFAERCGITDHLECQRVEVVLGDLVQNRIQHRGIQVQIHPAA